MKEVCAGVTEGQFRLAELKKYLLSRNLPLAVFACEDSARVKSEVKYDLKSKCLSGLVLPNDENGCPFPNHFKATSAESIQNHFQSAPKSNYAYTTMVAPLSVAAPSFGLCVFGSDNKFQAEDVIRRWKWMTPPFME